jgi:hypothetical protein
LHDAERRAEQRVSDAEAAASSSEQAVLVAKSQAKDSDQRRQGVEKKLVRADCCSINPYYKYLPPRT